MTRLITVNSEYKPFLHNTIKTIVFGSCADLKRHQLTYCILNYKISHTFIFDHKPSHAKVLKAALNDDNYYLMKSTLLVSKEKLISRQ